MPTLTIEYRDDSERLALEQAIAYVSQLRQVALTASDARRRDTTQISTELSTAAPTITSPSHSARRNSSPASASRFVNQPRSLARKRRQRSPAETCASIWLLDGFSSMAQKSIQLPNPRFFAKASLRE
ncbi:MAG: hypothetical protein EXS16_21865 [Gemmataceae bacterium]|nr:hypothetical protein [Gemmataceae bacterium]